jgi:hypothetical protein
MAVLSKAQNQANINSDPTLTTAEKTILKDMVDSYQDLAVQMDTATRDAIPTPSGGQLIYNTDTNQFEYWNGAAWVGMGQALGVPMTVKVDLNTADLLALDTTPIPLVAAPGSGFYISPLSVAFRYTFVSVAYDFAEDLVVEENAGAGYFFTVDESIVNAGANRSGQMRQYYDASNNLFADNTLLRLRTNTAATVGDGTLTLWITYVLLTV